MLLLGLWMSCAAAAVTSVVRIEPGQTTASLASQIDFWVDPLGSQSLEVVEATGSTLPFELQSHRQVHLLEGKALWLRFDVHVKDSVRRWLVELELAGVDLAELYYRGADGKWVTQRAGDSLPLSAWPQKGRFPVFSLAGVTEQPVRYYLRVQHARVPYSGVLALISDAGLVSEHETDHLLLGAYFGLAGLMVVMALAIGITYRDNAFATYALYVFLLAMTQAAFSGIAALYLWPEQPRWSQSSVFIIPMLAAASALGFVRVVCSPKQFAIALDRLILGLMFGLVAIGGVDAVLPTLEGFRINNILLSAALAIALLVVGLSVWEGDRHARWIALGFFPVIVAAMFPLLRNFGLLPANLATGYALVFGSALEAPILFYGLYRRLSERREAAARTAALSQNDPLTGLLLQRVLQIRLRGSLLRAKRYQQQCALLLVDVSNFNALQETNGREVAMRALVVAASQLRTVVRDIDSVARIGEHQFALLLEAPSTAANALSVATHAVARGLRETPVLPDGQKLKFRVVAALLPLEHHNEVSVIEWMQNCLTRQDEKSPKAIQALNF